MFTLSAVLILGTGAIAGEGDGYLYRITTAEELERLSVPERFLPGVDRITKFLVPARDDPALLAPVFQNVNVYPYHQEFLAAEFSDRFPGLGGEEYAALVERRASRSYFAGALFRFQGESAHAYGFDVFTLANDPGELPTLDEALWIFRQLAPVFKLGAPAYAPVNAKAIENARGWQSPELPVSLAFSDAGDVTYQAYTIAPNYGRVRVFTEEELAEANETGGFGSQDIVVVDQAPADIEGVIAGVVTGSIQSELGHLAIRTLRRGTPNAFVRDATRAFAPYDGKMVRLDAMADGYTVTEATLADAEAWWAAHRPDLSREIPEVDAEYALLDATGEAPLDGPVRPVTRYGGKGANFLRLFTLIPEENRVPGFVVPFRYYLRFLATNLTRSAVNPTRRVTFARYIEELLEDPAFRGDSRKRFEALEDLRKLIERDGVVDPELVASLARRVREVFGSVERPVRCRSSSNAEDLLEFNGAGLYSSTSACAADDLDVGTGGPSICDPQEEDERGLARGLKRVWASLWNFRAYEEREYYQIPHSKVRMAVLVSDAFPDELANGVAFTGNPAVRGDHRFLVNAQLGDVEVVFTDPKVVAEKDVLEMVDGRVAGIVRVRGSSLVPEGTHVLSDDNLRELGALMAHVEGKYPLELGSHARDEVLLDFELKLDRPTGRIRLKQVRPFLIPETGAGPPSEVLVRVPAGLTACASFMEGRPNADVLRFKARVGLKAQEGKVRSDGSSAADLFEWLELSPGGPRVPPLGRGVWRAFFSPGPPPGFRYSMHQDFRVEGKLVRVSIAGIIVPRAEGQEVLLDPPALTWATSPYGLHLEYTFPEEPPGAAPTTWLLPCDLSHLPLHGVDVELSSGDRLRFEERFQQLKLGTGPAELVRARVTLGGREQVVEDYWRLVYSAGHHNDTPYPELWAVLDPPIDLAGVGRVKVVAVAQNHKGQEPTASFLGEDLREIHRPRIVLFRRQLVGSEETPQFRRGDANSSGRLNVADAIGILLHLFQGGPLACPDAADFDDIGSVEWDDAILLLRYLFLGLDAPEPPGPGRCGEDPTPDDLPECDGAGCR
ncbi:MAG: hypothetical protein HY721_13530 [Planctomycetes bacterium]|nr:hypothetical protein [Planctomycetota bacterium]